MIRHLVRLCLLAAALFGGHAAFAANLCMVNEGNATSSCQSAAAALNFPAIVKDRTTTCNLSYPATEPCFASGKNDRNETERFDMSVRWVTGPDTTPACQQDAGKTLIKNWTVGYTRTPDDNDYAAVGTVNRVPGAGKGACFNGCTGNQGSTDEPGWKAWKSQTPTTQGLYRNSLDIPFKMTGEACNADSAPALPTTPNATCPGYVGEVNGKKGCFGTASAPIIPESVPPPISKPPEAGNPPAGPVATNAGTTGASRTPSAGDGGNAGGPAAAAVGGKGGTGGGTASGTGTVKAPATGDQQANCGAPGQPICDVKINEGDMPKDGTTFKAANEKLDDNVKATGDHIKSIQNEESKPSWSFSFQLPTGCSPYQVASFKGTAFTMDPCAYQATIHDLMSMVWAAATAFCLIGMVGRTLRST